MWPLMKWDLVEPSRVPPSLTFTMARLPGYYSQTHLSAPKLTVLTIKEECFVLGNARTLKISFLCSSRGTNATIMPVSATSMSRPQKQYKKLTLHCFTHLHMFRFSRFLCPDRGAGILGMECLVNRIVDWYCWAKWFSERANSGSTPQVYSSSWTKKCFSCTERGLDINLSSQQSVSFFIQRSI